MIRTIIKSALAIASSAMLLVSCSGSSSQAELASNSKPAIAQDKNLEARVQKTLKGMTIEEKAGQLVQLSVGTILGDNDLDDAKVEEIFGRYKVGSILNTLWDKSFDREYTAEMVAKIQNKSMELIGIPTIYGLDMIHGATYLSDGSFFPQEVNLAATFNTKYPAIMGEAIGYETRAAMVPWVFSPVMDLTRNPVWSRNWESYGEDPYLQSVMASIETKAIQGENPNEIDLDHTAVSIKHFMGYGATRSGKDRTPAYVSPLDLREKYFAPFKECIEAGALTVMVNSASLNGVPTHANKTLLTGWLKEGLNWDGMIVTDWADIDNLYTREHIAVDKKDAIRIGINAGIDMIMDPYDPKACDLIVELVKEGAIPQARLDDACARVIRLKYRLGLFDNPTWDVTGYDKFACDEYKNASYEAAVESEVLLKNEGGILPLKKGTKILVTGPNSNSMRSLNGGWSYTWQGTNDSEYVEKFNTIYEAIRDKFGASNVKLAEAIRYDEGYSMWQNEVDVNIASAVAAASGVDVIVACVGEQSYCETPGNIDDITLSKNQRELVKALAKTGKPIVLVLNEGRPRVINEIEPLAKAVIDVMLPSNYGADALASLLCGEENFSGKLPFTYPKYVNTLHTYDFKVSEQTAAVMEGSYNYDAVMDVQYPFGAGLSYTTFEYSDLKCNKTEFKAGDVLKFEVSVKNTGSVAGKESVLLFSSDVVASVIPDSRRLRAFDKVELQPGQSKVVTLEVPATDLAFVGQDNRWTLEEGDFKISVGGKGLVVKCTETKIWNTQNK
ncbi:MAG: glycoside hydrolase family 3 C-terminal domain-containing protein [Bacteroidales bacterium]|nr:glycoside hydrolase family 3 C-terminal domain-containing protein [Bacteroidales bacterium]